MSSLLEAGQKTPLPSPAPEAGSSTMLAVAGVLFVVKVPETLAVLYLHGPDPVISRVYVTLEPQPLVITVSVLATCSKLSSLFTVHLTAPRADVQSVFVPVPLN